MLGQKPRADLIIIFTTNRFASFFIDLRDIRTTTETGQGKAGIVKLFENHLAGKPNATEELKQSIQPSTNRSYRKGEFRGDQP